MISWTPGWSVRPPETADEVVAIADGSVLRAGSRWLFSWDEVRRAVPAGVAPVYVGELDQRGVFVAEVDPALLTVQSEAVSLRDAMLTEPDAPADILGLAWQVRQWWHDHRFCGRCGQETTPHPLERARWCERCTLSWYPRVAPCVIVVIRNGDRMLLARSSRVKRNFYSLIAGFVEAGESLEQAVAREVREETGLEVHGIRYQGSQPWPFPHQLMLGFFADYAGGELVLQEDELADAGWFRPGEMPPVPPQTTIAGRLIRAMAEEILA